jgi:hypothetical protein
MAIAPAFPVSKVAFVFESDPVDLRRLPLPVAAVNLILIILL